MNTARQATLIALAGILSLAAASAEAALVTVDVKAKIAGKAKPQTIGTIKADGGFTGVPSGMNGFFEFAKGYGYLDDTYDFDWLNICTAEKGDSGLFAKKPAFDPQPDPIVAGEDKIPFYYNDTEFHKNNKFSGKTIHEDGKSSQFIDFPKLPKDQGFEFSAFLAIRDNGKYSLSGKLETCILAGWTWKYDGDDKFGTGNNGTSTAIASITIDDKVVKLFGDCVTNNDSFKGWSAVIGCELPKNVPTPGALAVLGLGGLLAARRRR